MCNNIFIAIKDCIALILNAPCDRTVEEPLQIHIKLDERSPETAEEMIEEVCAKMWVSGTYPHVTVTCDSRVIEADLPVMVDGALPV